MDRPIVLVTGAGGALGSAVRERLTRDGARLALLARRAPAGEAGGPAADGAAEPAPWAAAVDLLDEAAVTDAIDRAETELGPVRAALLLAGGFATAPAAETDLGALRQQLDVNLATAASVVRALLPRMTERGEGTIVGIAAGQARRGGSGAAAYAASKAALAAYLRAVDEESASRGVRTVTVFPMGTLDTPANRQAMPKADPARWIDPARLAEVLAFAVRIGPRARLREIEVHPDA
ncbi:MAG: SDR family NAD(P)-dependent oxidoreductase [Trueperaceae bacterium]|nr:SDR family NAD(P)-dependent oxidoreductase [Trueperaceae bacterium]